MEFCAPFFAVSHFNWTGADLVTVLRNPVDRVWSMYRFQTMSCYKCLPLKEIYNRIDNGTTEGEILHDFFLDFGYWISYERLYSSESH